MLLLNIKGRINFNQYLWLYLNLLNCDINYKVSVDKTSIQTINQLKNFNIKSNLENNFLNQKKSRVYINSKDYKNYINFKNYNNYMFLLSKINTDTETHIQYNSFANYQHFNTYYLNSIYKLNLREKHVNVLQSLPLKIIKYVLYKVKHKHFKKFKIKYFNEVIYMFLVCVWLKNSKLLCKFIKRKLDSVHFKKHRSYFLFFFKILNLYIIPNLTLLKVKGITLKFKGKLGRGGNSRKKTTFYHKKYYSLSNKCLSLNQHKWNVWTQTGAVGCVFQIFY